VRERTETGRDPTVPHPNGWGLERLLRLVADVREGITNQE
jgi:hypothetical protein